jgi:hypothetical protein
MYVLSFLTEQGEKTHQRLISDILPAAILPVFPPRPLFFL